MSDAPPPTVGSESPAEPASATVATAPKPVVQAVDQPVVRGPRWWPFALAAITFLVVVFILATRWTGITGSHPAYLVTLLAVLVGAVALGVWAVVARKERPARGPTRRWLVRGAGGLGVIALLAVLLWLRPMAATQRALDAMRSDATVQVHETATRIELRPANPRRTGLVFYPGALVDPRAYATTLRPLAEQGFTVVVIKLPYGIAFFDPNGARSVIGAEDGIDRWVIGGHSLGGTVAARYAGGGHDKVAGLLLWASYPASSIAGRTNLQVASVSGTADGLATPDDIERSKSKLPPGTTFTAVDGAIHAFFGDYGSQSGDGTPTISREDAQRQIDDASLALLEKIDAG